MSKARKRRKRKIRKENNIEHLSPLKPHQVAQYGKDMRRTTLQHWWCWYNELKYGQF